MRVLLPMFTVSRVATAFVVGAGRRSAVGAFLSSSSPRAGELELVRGDGAGGEGLIVQPKGGSFDSVLIFMHGLGDSANGWAPAMPSLGLSRTKVILPTARDREITLNGGYVMPGWFDLTGLSPDAPEDKEGFAESTARILHLIEKEVASGTPLGKIALGGFSQGGAMALHVALRGLPLSEGGESLAGCLAMSAWLPFRKEYPSCLPDGRSQPPVLQCHGDADPVVPYAWGKTSFELLRTAAGVQEVIWREYGGMAHSACDEELQDASEFLRRVLGYETTGA